LNEVAEIALRAGQSVIVDATYLEPTEILALFRRAAKSPESGNAWLGREDSNLRMGNPLSWPALIFPEFSAVEKLLCFRQFGDIVVSRGCLEYPVAW
jgi:hypothetical protein